MRIIVLHLGRGSLHIITRLVPSLAQSIRKHNEDMKHALVDPAMLNRIQRMSVGWAEECRVPDQEIIRKEDTECLGLIMIKSDIASQRAFTPHTCLYIPNALLISYYRCSRIQ